MRIKHDIPLTEGQIVANGNIDLEIIYVDKDKNLVEVRNMHKPRSDSYHLNLEYVEALPLKQHQSGADLEYGYDYTQTDPWDVCKVHPWERVANLRNGGSLYRKPVHVMHALARLEADRREEAGPDECTEVLHKVIWVGGSLKGYTEGTADYPYNRTLLTWMNRYTFAGFMFEHPNGAVIGPTHAVRIWTKHTTNDTNPDWSHARRRSFDIMLRPTHVLESIPGEQDMPETHGYCIYRGEDHE